MSDLSPELLQELTLLCVYLVVSGWQYLDKLQRHSTEGNYFLVAFTGEYTGAIRLLCSDHGMSCNAKRPPSHDNDHPGDRNVRTRSVTRRDIRTLHVALHAHRVAHIAQYGSRSHLES